MRVVRNEWRRLRTALAERRKQLTQKWRAFVDRARARVEMWRSRARLAWSVLRGAPPDFGDRPHLIAFKFMGQQWIADDIRLDHNWERDYMMIETMKLEIRARERGYRR